MTRYCKTCGHKIITTKETDYIFRINKKPKKFQFYMHHCPNCMGLDFTTIPENEKEMVIFT